MAEQTEAPKPKKNALSSLVWWKPEPEKIEKQVREYSTLSIWKSARGVSALLCVLSVAMTTLLGRFLGLTGGSIVAEAVIWLGLGTFMYRGQQWAFAAGMVLWTLEKAFILATTIGSNATAPIVQILWWLVYMNAFFLGYKVEQRRRGPAVVEPSVPG